MPFRKNIFGLGCGLLLASASSVIAQDKDLSEMVEQGEALADSYEIAPLETNESLLEKARQRVKALDLPNVETAPVGDIFGYDFEAEVERQLNVLEEPTLYIFVSFSMEDSLIEDYVREASEAGGLVVIGGLHNESFKQTVQKVATFIDTELGPVNGGVIIDPKSFETFGVTRVPTILLAEAPLAKCLSADCIRDVPVHDRIQGSVSLEYALKLFAAEGDLQSAAEEKLGKISRDIYSVYKD